MSTFKVFYDKESKTVLCKGKIADFEDYESLKKKIIDSTNNPTFKAKHKVLSEKDKILLTFGEEPVYIPPELKEGIWSNKTFLFLKQKLESRKAEEKYKFYTSVVENFPEWEEKGYHDVLKDALQSSWKPICDDLNKELTLLKLEEGQRVFAEQKEKLASNALKNQEKHLKIICNNCFKKDFCGKRFICSDCKNYNLCEECEKLLTSSRQIHPRDHLMIQINKPLNDDVDNLFKYDNIFGLKDHVLENQPSTFKLEFSCINSGENDLQDCWVLPIRYGDDYLCSTPKKIEDSIKRNERITISLIVKLPFKNEKGIFHGYFRMFTPNGLPFGNILHAQVINGD